MSFLCLWVLAERLKLGKEIIWVENFKHSVRHTFCLNNFNLHVTRILKNPQSDPHPWPQKLLSEVHKLKKDIIIISFLTLRCAIISTIPLQAPVAQFSADIVDSCTYSKRRVILQFRISRIFQNNAPLCNEKVLDFRRYSLWSPFCQKGRDS